MGNCIDFVFYCIRQTVTWLKTWSFYGVPFLYFFIGLAVISIILRMVL